MARRIPTNKFNLLCTLALLALVIFQFCILKEPAVDKLKDVRDLSTFGMTTAVTVLGFLIAGFTIFATISQPEMLVAMSRIVEKKSGLSYLKFNFFIFIRVFIYYLAYSLFCLSVLTFGVKGGLVHELIKLSPISQSIREWLLGFAYVVLNVGLFFLLFQLKSFIFNVHHCVMTAIRWRSMPPDNGGNGQA